MSKKIKFILSAIIIVFSSLVLLADYLFGGAISFVESITDYYTGAGMVEGEDLTEENLNDPEFVRVAIISNKENLNAMNLIMMDYSTTERIFNGIHEYDTYREEEKEITYTYRTADKDEALNEINVYTGAYVDPDVKAQNTKGKKTVSLSVSSIEQKTERYGDGVLDMRWQPIYAACVVIASDKYDGTKDVSDVDMSNTTFEGYYLSAEDVETVCKLFEMNIDFKFDATSKKKYTFSALGSKKGAYKLKVYNTEDGGKITERIPASAPERVHNEFLSYSYQYESIGIENTELCKSRYMVVTPSVFIETLRGIDPDFDMDLFRDVLAELPATEDLVEFYSREEWDTMVPFDEIIEADTMDDFGNVIYSSQCPSIGVIYHAKNDAISSEVEVEWDEGDTFAVPLYPYSAADRELLVEEEEGYDYGLYHVYKYALKPCTQSDGLNHEQLKEVIENCCGGYYVSHNSCLFNEANIDDTVDTLLRFQDEKGCSVIFLLSIMRTEGAIIGSYGNTYYNFFNIKGDPPIPGSNGFKNYWGAGYSMQEALYEQINTTIYNNYIERGQVNYFLFSWNNYDGVSYDSLSHCYCPVWDDPGMPWAEGSWWDGRTLSTEGKGWVNSNALFMYEIESWAESNLDDWSHEPFSVDENSDESWFGKAGDYLHKLFFGN